MEPTPFRLLADRTAHRPTLGFLSEDLTYSCAIFSELDADLKTPDAKLEDSGFWSASGKTYDPILQFDDPPVSIPSSPTSSPPEYIFDDLNTAQMRKVRHIISKAQIKPGHRVLEIGSGWGTMAITIARTVPGTQIDSITLSVAQRDLAMQRIRKAGLEDRIRIHLMDYRSMPASWKGSFDRLVSVEMMEAVGREYMDTFWKEMNWAMKPESAVGVVQCITLPEARMYFLIFPMKRYLTPLLTTWFSRLRRLLQQYRFYTEMGPCLSMLPAPSHHHYVLADPNFHSFFIPTRATLNARPHQSECFFPSVVGVTCD